MGLTIHYNLKAPEGATADQMITWLESARQHALTLNLAEVSKVAHFTAKRQIDPPRGSDWFWAMIQAGDYVDVGRSTSTSVKPTEAILFRTWPGQGCEEANFGFCRYPTKIKYEDRMVAVKDSGWRWHSFCKTQYASESGIAHFLKCHLAVVSILDHLDDLGLVAEVSDEGEYWDKRNVKELANEVGEWNGMIAALFGAMKDAGANVEAPIFDFANFEHLEMQGREKISPEGIRTLLAELDKITAKAERDTNE